MTQLHDFNPGIAQSGLFWTVPVNPDAVDVDLGAGTATYSLTGARMPDYLTFDNAINRTGPVPRPGVVSFTVTWNTTGAAVVNDVPLKKFHGEHAPANAQMAWTGRSGDFDFVSHPIDTSVSSYGALLGRQRTGSFY